MTPNPLATVEDRWASRKILILTFGMLIFACIALARSQTDGALLGAARRALPKSISSNEISSALDVGLWNSNGTAIAVCFTNSNSSRVFVFLKQAGGAYLPVDVSIEGLSLEYIGVADRVAYERVELKPLQWLHRDDGMFMVLMRTRVWKAGRRYTHSKPLLIQKDGTVLQQ